MWLWSFMHKFQQIVDYVVSACTPFALTVYTTQLWSLRQSANRLSEALSPPRCLQAISFEMTHKESIENDHNREWMRRWRCVAREQMSTHTLRVWHVIALYKHYRRSQMEETIAVKFRYDNNFLKCRRKEQRNSASCRDTASRHNSGNRRGWNIINWTLVYETQALISQTIEMMFHWRLGLLM